jgi:tetratricopeptide (TPR) repeat protein
MPGAIDPCHNREEHPENRPEESVASFPPWKPQTADRISDQESSTEVGRKIIAGATQVDSLYPHSSTAYESLAYAFYSHGKKGPAITCFKKVLELDPDNRNAKKMIQRLKSDR